MINIDQLARHIIRPALTAVGLDGANREQLLVGTCAKESNLGTYIIQVGGGPAKGIFQIEDSTYQDIIDNYVSFRPNLQTKIFNACGFIKWPSSDELVTNMKLSAIMAAIKYLRAPGPLPKYNDIEGQAEYWKKYYNTAGGAGTAQQYIKTYNEFVGNFYT